LYKDPLAPISHPTPTAVDPAEKEEVNAKSKSLKADKALTYTPPSTADEKAQEAQGNVDPEVERRMDPEERALRDRIATVKARVAEIMDEMNTAEASMAAAESRGYIIPETRAKAKDEKEKEIAALFERQDSARRAGDGFSVKPGLIRRPSQKSAAPKEAPKAYIDFTVGRAPSPKHDDIGAMFEAEADSESDTEDSPPNAAGKVRTDNHAANDHLDDIDENSDDYSYDDAPVDELQAAGYDNNAEEVSGFGGDADFTDDE
jgi:hypothetical protein